MQPKLVSQLVSINLLGGAIFGYNTGIEQFGEPAFMVFFFIF